MNVFSNLFKRKDENKENEIIEFNKVENDIENEDEIAAVIAAAIASMDEEEEVVAAITVAIACVLGKSTTDFVVKNIKRTSEIDSLWALNGRMNLMR